MVQESFPPSINRASTSTYFGLRIQQGGTGVIEPLRRAVAVTPPEPSLPRVAQASTAVIPNRRENLSDEIPKSDALDDLLGQEVRSFHIDSYDHPIPFGGVFSAHHTSLQLSASVYAMDLQQALVDASCRDAYLERIKIAQPFWHPNLIRILGVTTVGSYHLLITENPGVDSLYDQVVQQGKLSEVTALRLAATVTDVLELGLEKGLRHDQICPQNLFMMVSGQTKLIDYGWPFFGDLAGPDGRYDNELWEGKKRQPVPLWVRAPEQLMAVDTPDYRADIYALGITLYFMLTGQPPFLTSSVSTLLHEQSEVAISPLQLNPALTVASSQLILSMIRLEPDRRLSDYAELRSRIKTILQDLTGESTL